jgi:hypothetical protein
MQLALGWLVPALAWASLDAAEAQKCCARLAYHILQV